MTKKGWIAAGISAGLVTALGIGLTAAQASSGSTPANGTRQTTPASMMGSNGETSAQCQAMHDQMEQMMGSEMGSGMMDGSSGMTDGAGMMGDAGSTSTTGGGMAAHHPTGSGTSTSGGS